MKKLFALVLTLALVFAIAAPAMAATWGAGTAPTGSPFAVKVDTYKVTYDAFGNPVYSALGNTAVVEGTPVAFKVTFTVPSTTAIATYYKDMTGLTYEAGIALTNLSNVVEVTDASAIATDAAGVITIAMGPMAPTTSTKNYSVTYTATVASTAKALVEAYIGYAADDELPAVYGAYSFSATGVTKTVDTLTTGVEFTLNGSSVVTGWTLDDGANTYTLLNSSGALVFVTVGSGVIVSSGAAYEALNDIYKEFVAVLGFNYASTGVYYTEANIIANYQPGGYAEATGTFLPYSSSLTVTDGTSVPNTGDNMSVIGFVMVGLAILATAAVVVKKVRA